MVGTGLAEVRPCGGKQATFTSKYTGDSTRSPCDCRRASRHERVYMSRETYAEIFGTDPDDFIGYASDKTLNLNERYASEMTPARCPPSQMRWRPPWARS